MKKLLLLCILIPRLLGAMTVDEKILTDLKKLVIDDTATDQKTEIPLTPIPLPGQTELASVTKTSPVLSERSLDSGRDNKEQSGDGSLTTPESATRTVVITTPRTDQSRPLSSIWVAMNEVFASKDNKKVQAEKLKVLDKILKDSKSPEDVQWIESKKPHTDSIRCFFGCCGCDDVTIEIAPVHRAAQKGHVGVLALFKKHGFNMDVGHRGSGKWSPLMHAVAAKQTDAIDFLILDVGEAGGVYVTDCFCDDCSTPLCITCHKPTRKALKSAKRYKEVWCCLCCFCDGCDNA